MLINEYLYRCISSTKTNLDFAGLNQSFRPGRETEKTDSGVFLIVLRVFFFFSNVNIERT